MEVSAKVGAEKAAIPVVRQIEEGGQKAVRGPGRRAVCYTYRMQDVNNLALKEWAVAVKAMEAGEQILILRKGGITEANGAFEVEAREFWLFPNHTHQNAAQLQPRAHALLEASDAERPAAGTVEITSYAVVEDAFIVPDEAALARLDNEHLWTYAYVADRLRWKPQQPLVALALRVYRLPAPVVKEYLPAYGGCTSWVTLDASLSTGAATPVLDDEAFAELLERLRRLMS